jgi:hypothetical protein
VNDPIRFREQGSGASEELRRLFQAGAEDLPSVAELSSLATRLSPIFEPPPPQSPITRATVVKVAAVSTLVVGAAVLFALNFGPHGTRPPDAPERWTPDVPSKPESGAAAPSGALSAAPSGSEAATAPSGDTAPAVPSNAPAANASGHANSVNARPAESEAELLERARGLLGSSPGRALALTDLHRARFPSGVLAQEREVIAIEALKRLGRTDDAARRAADFARRYPGSAYRKKLDSGSP